MSKLDWNTIINTFGFPIACVIGCGWFIYQLWSNSTKENQLREERSYQMLGKFQVSLDKFADILAGYEAKLTIIEKDVKDIKVIVNK